MVVRRPDPAHGKTVDELQAGLAYHLASLQTECVGPGLDLLLLRQVEQGQVVAADLCRKVEQSLPARREIHRVRLVAPDGPPQPAVAWLQQVSEQREALDERLLAIDLHHVGSAFSRHLLQLRLRRSWIVGKAIE